MTAGTNFPLTTGEAWAIMKTNSSDALFTANGILLNNGTESGTIHTKANMVVSFQHVTGLSVLLILVLHPKLSSLYLDYVRIIRVHRQQLYSFIGNDY